ncbi:hypothetical protein JCM5296_006769 [Sporobolomyces johnsonii]
MANWLGEDPPRLWADPHHRSMYREPSSQFPPHPTRTFPPSEISNVTQPNAFTGLSNEAQTRHDKIQSLLNKTLGPEQIANRPGGGGAKLTYLEGWKAINLANEVFGYNGWFTDIKYLEADFIDYDPDTKRYSMGVTAIIRVRLQDGASHEDVGYGKLENTKSKADGLDKCKKEAVTDGLKRALRHFGKLLGNCLYDKHYLEGLARMKAPKPKFDFASIYKPDEDNVPFSHKPQSAYPAAQPQQATSASTSMPPPAPPLKIDAVQTHGHPPKHPPSMIGGAGAGLARAQTTTSGTAADAAAAAGGGSRPAAANANANLRNSTTSTSSKPAPRRSATISISKPNPLDRTGAASALEFALNSDDESVLARMELPVGTGVGNGGTEENGNESERMCFEGDDSGFAEECEGLKDENAPLPPAPNPLHRPLNKSSSFSSPILDIQSHHPRTAAQQQAEANKAAAIAKLQLKAKLAAANGGGGGGGAGEQGTAVRAGMAMGVGLAQSLAPPNALLQPSAAPRPGLRPAQPPSRSNSLNKLPPPVAAAAPRGPVRQAGALPTLNVGPGIVHAQAHSEGPIPQEASGGGFVSARGVKRAVGDGYYPSPPRPVAGHPPGRAQTLSGSGVREPLGELEVADGGAVKRPRA